MAETNKQPVGWPGTVADNAASFPITTPSKPVAADDEWEYEYSTTETEVRCAPCCDGCSVGMLTTRLSQTYYVTMDLSHTGMFDKVKDSFHTQTRGGYRQWFNPVYADPNKNTRLRPTKTNAILLDEDNYEDDADEVAPPEGDDDADEGGTKGAGGSKDQDNSRQEKEDVRTPGQRASSRPPSRAASRAPSVVPQAQLPRLKNVGEIQVLDLHSDNPIISYKGRIFSGSWARNIGTELVFGAHDEIAERGLPYLRTLPGGVDLMAASTARILTTPADLRPNATRGNAAVSSRTTTNPARRQGPDRYKWLRKASGIEIPIAFDKHGRRKPQARFLENLMAIKRSRGEQDDVTTITRETCKDFVSREDDPEEATNQKKRARDRRRQQRLIEERAMRPKRQRRGGNRWANKVVTFADGVRDEEEEEDGGGTLSAKTPANWDDLQAQRTSK